MDLTLHVRDLKHLRAIFWKCDLFERDQNDAVLSAIVVAQLEIAFRKFRIPPDAVQQFVYRYHRS